MQTMSAIRRSTAAQAALSKSGTLMLIRYQRTSGTASAWLSRHVCHQLHCCFVPNNQCAYCLHGLRSSQVAHAFPLYVVEPVQSSLGVVDTRAQSCFIREARCWVAHAPHTIEMPCRLGTQLFYSMAMLGLWVSCCMLACAGGSSPKSAWRKSGAYMVGTHYWLLLHWHQLP